MLFRKLHFYEGIFDITLHFSEGIIGCFLHFYEGIFFKSTFLDQQILILYFEIILTLCLLLLTRKNSLAYVLEEIYPKVAYVLEEISLILAYVLENIAIFAT